MRLKLMYYFRPSPRKTFSLIKNPPYLAKSFEKTINIDPIHKSNIFPENHQPIDYFKFRVNACST